MTYGLPSKSQPVECPQCGAEVAQVPGPGKIKRFCTPQHGRSWRRRARALGWPI